MISHRLMSTLLFDILLNLSKQHYMADLICNIFSIEVYSVENKICHD